MLPSTYKYIYHLLTRTYKYVDRLLTCACKCVFFDPVVLQQGLLLVTDLLRPARRRRLAERLREVPAHEHQAVRRLRAEVRNLCGGHVPVFLLSRHHERVLE